MFPQVDYMILKGRDHILYCYICITSSIVLVMVSTWENLIDRSILSNFSPSKLSECVCGAFVMALDLRAEIGKLLFLSPGNLSSSGSTKVKDCFDWWSDFSFFPLVSDQGSWKAERHAPLCYHYHFDIGDGWRFFLFISSLDKPADGVWPGEGWVSFLAEQLWAKWVGSLCLSLVLSEHAVSRGIRSTLVFFFIVVKCR